MDKDNCEYTERKKKLILTIFRMLFEENCMDYVKSEKWQNVEDLNAWFDEALREYDKTREIIIQYFDTQTYS